MADTSGGRKPPDPDPRIQSNDSGIKISPGQGTKAPAWGACGGLGGGQQCRSFQQIIEDEKRNRNIIEIQLVKDTENNNDENSHRALTFDELGELIFDVIGIPPSDCLTFDYTSRADIKQIKLKPTVSADQYVTVTAINFKGFEVSVRKQLNNVTRVTFKNVPINVPDEEVINLCKSYGTPLDQKVMYESMNNTRNKGMQGSTRFVDMQFNQGMNMMNYYWMEGPLSGDQGKRVLVLHNGQIPQCSHCLRRAGNGGCPAGGNGKACNLLKTPRAKMAQYMQSLREKIGYVSLKTRFLELQAKNFPSLQGFDTDIVNNMEEHDVECTDILPENPIEVKDRYISNLEKEIEVLKATQDENDSLKKALAQSKLDLSTTQKKISFTQKATENRILECISDPTGFHTDPLLIGVYSATLDEKSFNFEKDDIQANSPRSRKDLFLKSIEDKLDLKNTEHVDRLNIIKNQILEKVKVTQESRARSRSGSVGLKRELSSDSLSGLVSSPIRQKLSGIPKPK